MQSSPTAPVHIRESLISSIQMNGGRSFCICPSVFTLLILSIVGNVRSNITPEVEIPAGVIHTT